MNACRISGLVTAPDGVKSKVDEMREKKLFSEICVCFVVDDLKTALSQNGLENV